MSDDKKPDIYFAKVEGQVARLIRGTDARLVKRYVLDAIHPPKVEVRRPTTEEAMDMALDGVEVEDARPKPDGNTELPLPEVEEPAPDLNDPVRTNPDDEVQPDE